MALPTCDNGVAVSAALTLNCVGIQPVDQVSDGMVDPRDVLVTEKQLIGRAYKTSTGWSVIKIKGPQIDRGYASRHFTFTSAEVIFTGR